jgi:putative colanic acid biosynthesis acetyltransferase WcaF
MEANDAAVRSRLYSPYTLRQRVGRVCWDLVWLLLFRPSPRPLWAWRRGLLKLFGAKIAATAKVYSGVRVWAPWLIEVGEYTGIADGVVLYSQARIAIGSRCVVSQEAFLCAGTHDYSRRDFPLVTKPIQVGDDVWIAARAFVHPGVTIESRSVIGACAVVTKNVAAGVVMAGNPAVLIKRI